MGIDFFKLSCIEFFLGILRRRIFFWFLNFFQKKMFKGVGVDNWALFYKFSSEVSEKPGFRIIFFSNT
jgi:hypothetical protein